MALEAIKPADFHWFPYEGFTFCLGLAEGEHAWTSGHTAAKFDPAIGKMRVEGTMREQARTAAMREDQLKRSLASLRQEVGVGLQGEIELRALQHEAEAERGGQRAGDQRRRRQHREQQDVPLALAGAVGMAAHQHQPGDGAQERQRAEEADPQGSRHAWGP